MEKEKTETGFNEPSFDGVCSVCGFPKCFVKGRLESTVFCPRCLKTQKRSFPRKKGED